MQYFGFKIDIARVGPSLFYNVQYTVYSIQYTVYSIQYTVYSIQI